MSSYNFSTGYQSPPLVPVYRPMPSQASASNHQVKPSTPPLDDECCICLDAFRNKVESDGRSFRMIAKTDCNHFFHDFCLTEHLQHGMNKNCPLCRAPVNNVTKVNLDYVQPQQNSNPVAPSHVDYEESDSEDSDDINPLYDVASSVASTTINLGVGILSGLGAIALGSLQLGGALAVGLVKAGAVSLTRTHEDLKKAEGTKVASLYNNWNRVSKDVEKIMQTNNEEIAVLLSTVNSIPANRTYATQSSVERIERQTKIFEDKIKELQRNFNQFITEEKGLLSRV